MSELSANARSALERGLMCDGPSSARRERVKGRVLVALGGGASAAGMVSSVAEAAGSALSGGTVGGALGGGIGVKSLLGTSLLVWFATGIGAGVGVGGIAAVAQRASQQEVRAPLPAAPKLAEPSGAALPVEPALDTPPVPARELAPAVDLPAHDARLAAPARVNPAPAEAPGAGTPAANVDPTSMSEEASLLQQASTALALLAEHEQRFPSGVLAEERRVAKVLGLCALGRAEEATILARAFVARSPRSVLIPRLESSCVGKALAH
jgi:hypothetical protein